MAKGVEGTSAAAEPRVVRLEPCVSLAEACRHLAAGVGSTRGWAGGGGADRLTRLEQPLTGSVDPLVWLRAVTPPRFYWGSRDGAHVIAGAGVAEEVKGENFAVVSRAGLAGGASDLRYFLTSRFDLGISPSAAWREFGRVLLRLPLFELRTWPGGALIAVNLSPAASPAGAETVAGELQTAARAADRVVAMRRPSSDGSWRSEAEVALDRASGPDARAAWRSNVESLVSRIAGGRLRKAVLARTARLPIRVDSLDLLASAIAERSSAYRFYVQPSATAAFVGATPELLYRRRGRTIESEALAGTRPRGAGSAEDEELGRELLASGKDGEEHALVRDHIAGRLRPLCDRWETDEAPHLLRLSDVQHLRSRLAGCLIDGVDDGTVLGALHPTPAVCGTPPREALSLLRRLEGFDRGLYGGVVGVIGRDEAEVAVAIRGGLALEDELRLFAGSGIVAGSDPDAEWEETDLKVRAVAAILGASNAGAA